MITVAIVGPITPIGKGNHAIEFLENVAAGIALAKELAELGFAPYCPMLDFQYFLAGAKLTEEKVKAISLEWVRRCDAVVTLPTWIMSKGAQAEVSLAEYYNKPIFGSVKDLLDWSENGS